MTKLAEETRRRSSISIPAALSKKSQHLQRGANDRSNNTFLVDLNFVRSEQDQTASQFQNAADQEWTLSGPLVRSAARIDAYDRAELHNFEEENS